MRESTRLNKALWYNELKEKQQQLLILINYQSKQMVHFSAIDDAIQQQMAKIISAL